MAKKKTVTVTGLLNLHSETGTEGGYWSLQDENFITPNTVQFRCTKCNKFWDKRQDPDAPPQKSSSDGVTLVGSDSEGKLTFTHTYVPCESQAHDFQPSPPKWWSYEGLYVLKNGDHLTIFSREKADEILWQGVIQLKPYGVFTEHACGMWIHADQVGIPREQWAKWFFDKHRARLCTKATR